MGTNNTCKTSCNKQTPQFYERSGCTRMNSKSLPKITFPASPTQTPMSKFIRMEMMSRCVHCHCRYRYLSTEDLFLQYARHLVTPNQLL